MSFVKTLAATAILAHAGFVGHSQAADMQSVDVDGTAFVVTMPDGRVEVLVGRLFAEASLGAMGPAVLFLRRLCSGVTPAAAR